MIWPFTIIRDAWYTHQRLIDIQILWPVCIREAPDLDHAMAAFAIHCFHDPAWLILGEDTIAERVELLGAAAQMELDGG